MTVSIPSNLREVTTKRQTANGTRMIKCLKNAGVYYMSYANGYARRMIKLRSMTIKNGVIEFNHILSDRKYPLNPRQPWSRESVSYVMIPSEADRLQTIFRRAAKYSKDWSSYNERSFVCRNSGHQVHEQHVQVGI